MDLGVIVAVLAAIPLLWVGLVGLLMTYVTLLKPSLPGVLLVVAVDAYTLGLGGALLMYAWAPIPGREAWLASAYAPFGIWLAWSQVKDTRQRFTGRVLAREFLNAPLADAPAAQAKLLELVENRRLAERRGAARLLWRRLSRAGADEKRIAILSVLGPLEGESRRRRRDLVELLAGTEAESPLRTAVREALLHVGAQGLRYGVNDELSYHPALDLDLELRAEARHDAIVGIDRRISDLAPQYDHLALWETPASAPMSTAAKRRHPRKDERFDGYLVYHTASSGRDQSHIMELYVSDHEHRPRVGARMFSFPLARELVVGHVYTAAPSDPDLEGLVVDAIADAVHAADSEYRAKTPFSDAEAEHFRLGQRVEP